MLRCFDQVGLVAQNAKTGRALEAKEVRKNNKRFVRLCKFAKSVPAKDLVN